MSRLSSVDGYNRVLTTNDICVEKALLIYLEEKYTAEDNANGWRLYADYYTRLTLIDDNVNITSFRRQKHLSERVFKSLYEYETPSKLPQGLLISNPSNLFRLASLLNIEILILTEKHTIWFNSCKKPLSECTLPIETFIIANKNTHLRVLYTRPELPVQSCQRWIRIGGEFQYAFEKLMQFPRQTSIPTPPSLSSDEFIKHSEILQYDYKIQECIIVFQYVGNMMPSESKNWLRHVNFSQTFIYLGQEPNTETDINNVTPLFIYGDYLCVPTFTYIQELRRQIMNSRQHIRRDNRQFIPVASTSHLDVIRLNEREFNERRKKNALKRKRSYRKKARKRLRKMCGEEEDDEEEEEEKPERYIEKICQCHICDNEAPSNMSQHGQEQLTTIKMGCYDLLIMLGIDTLANRQIINTLCQWSIASFDIESMTQSVNNSTPLVNSFCRYNMQKHHSYIGGATEHFINIQKPIMIGHSDCFNTNVDIVQITDYIEEEEDNNTDDTNGDSYVYTMVERYWSDIVIPRHKAVIQAKETVAKPLLDYLHKYNVTHVNFITSKVQDDDELLGDALKTYHHTLPGLLESRITKLIQQYIIFSFYGSGYDMVMLEAFLIPFLYELSQYEGHPPPRIDKKGEKVTLIKLQTGISFRDITKLLAPSTNLRSFGALFELPVAKGHFPFSILKGPQSLKIPTLPKDKRTWQSTLSSNQDPITQTEVNEAIDFYNKSGFTNVGQYLKHYLTLDVKILQQATDLWRQRLAKVIGLDFIDIEKFTISSLSNYAGNHKSASLCRPGWFFPNNGQMYALLKRGMRG
jgi:DNA polymerase type B, organellar and viral